MTIARGSTITPVTGSGTTLASGSYNQAAGEHIVLSIGWETANGHVPTGVTDTAGNTYVVRSEASDAAQGCCIVDCVAPCLGNATNVITVTFGGAYTFTAMQGIRYTTTVGKTAFKAQNVAVTPTNTTLATAAFNAGDFAVASSKNFSGLTVSSPGSGYAVQIENGGTSGMAVQDRIDSPGGTYTAAVTYSGSTEIAIAGISYVEVSAASGGKLPFAFPLATDDRSEGFEGGQQGGNKFSVQRYGRLSRW